MSREGEIRSHCKISILSYYFHSTRTSSPKFNRNGARFKQSLVFVPFHINFDLDLVWHSLEHVCFSEWRESMR